MKIIWRAIDDETFEVWMNKDHRLKLVATLTHDEDGWQGINRIEELLKEMSKLFDIEFSFDF